MAAAAFGFVLGVIATWSIQNLVMPRFFRRQLVEVHVETHLSVIYAGQPNWMGYSFVVSPPLAELPHPTDEPCRAWQAWAASLGAFDGNHSELQVTVQCLGDAAVTVDALEVEYQRRVPVAGAAYTCAVGGAAMETRRIEIALDWPPGVVTFYDPRDAPTPFSFSLQKGQSEKFHIRAKATQNMVEWTAKLHLVVNGRRITKQITNNGRSFRTSGTTGIEHHEWAAGQWSSAPAD